MSVQTVFDQTAATYDRDRMKLIPCHEAFYRAALALIPASAQYILELGAGSGLFSAMLRANFPSAHLHLIDFSEPMLALARQRLGSSGDPLLTCSLADYTAHPLPAGCDAVVSSLSIHHLEDAAKRTLFERILTALRPGGLFVNADHIAGPTPELEREYQQRWLAEIRAAGATEQQIADSLFRQREDRRASFADQLQWLRDAGFGNVDCWFKDGSFAVFTATRSA